MRIGLITQLHGRPDAHPPTWDSVRDLALTAEAVGFDSFVFEDALLYRGDDSTDGCWESFSVAAALAVATERITLGQSVVNAPYRSPGLTAKSAETLHEIAQGRYVLGIGAGATPDSDYEAFGYPTDKRYSRFAEAIEIIHSLLKTGGVDFEGEFHSLKHAELVLRGPGDTGPSINIAAGGSKMLRLVAKYADSWNWWSSDETLDQIVDRVAPIIADLERACEESGRDPDTLTRTFDVYSIVPPGFSGEGSGMDSAVTGGPQSISEFICGLAELGISEVRCDLTEKTTEGVEAMQPVVEIVHSTP
jgi:alkanesulfonate monooxygenase SsuD/methylene tetrahydromethanopterin reductase-like flavin-dependent oxidoreductase (luciferase family)